MKYRKEVQEYIDFLDKYEVNENLEEFDVLHLYKGRLAFPNGYFDSRFFDLHLFNRNTMKKSVIEHRDGLYFSAPMDIDIVRIFADGSTLIRFKSMHSYEVTQAVQIL